MRVRQNPVAAREIRSSDPRMDCQTPTAAEIEALVEFRQDLLARINREGELHHDNAVSMLPPSLQHLVPSVVDELVDCGLITCEDAWLCAAASGAEAR